MAVQEVQISAKQILVNDYVGGQGWNTFGNANNGVAFIVSSTFSYVSNSLDRSLKYVTGGVSTTQDIHFKVPNIKIKNWQMPYINLYTQNVKAVEKIASSTKFFGRLTGVVGISMTLYELGTGQKNWFGEGGLDLIMGGVGFIGPYGWAISCAYFGVKMIL